MPVTLAEARNNTQQDYEADVIDEFRANSAILDSLIFHDAVSPAAGGATLDYGYRRLKTPATASFRALNTEYTDQNVETEKVSTTLAPLGGSFAVDRVIARLGEQRTAAVELNLRQKIKSTYARFQDEVINGDTAADANGFDGLDKALTGSSTEILAGPRGNWTDFDTDDRSHFKALDLLDEFLGELDGTPTIVLANSKALSRVRAIARRSGQYVRDPLEGLVGQGGRPVEREMYGGIILADPGTKAGTNQPIIPIETDGTTSIYAYRVDLDGFHGVSTAGGTLVQTWLPDFTTAGAVKRGEVELGPVGIALKATKAAGVLRGIQVRAAA